MNNPSHKDLERPLPDTCVRVYGPGCPAPINWAKFRKKYGYRPVKGLPIGVRLERPKK